jgi:GNAT superfamily N-acetyltransferase
MWRAPCAGPSRPFHESPIPRDPRVRQSGILYRAAGRLPDGQVVAFEHAGRYRSPCMEGLASARRATPADIESVTTIIELAFGNDPLWSRALSPLSVAQRRPFWRLFAEGTLRYPWTWLLDGGAAASLWIPPGGTEMSPEQEERMSELASGLGSEQDNFHELLRRFDTAHPRSEPHYYLSLLGTHPDHRGHGLGMRLLAHDLALIDEEHCAAYLESSNPANNRRYASAGFESVGDFSYPGDGPAVTTMWRSAR